MTQSVLTHDDRLHTWRLMRMVGIVDIFVGLGLIGLGWAVMDFPGLIWAGAIFGLANAALAAYSHHEATRPAPPA
jgi:hypothetical protein